jgi:myo-inositol-1(or 4)-monophosphatase
MEALGPNGSTLLRTEACLEAAMNGDAAVAVAAARAGSEVVRGKFAGPLQRFEKAPGDFATDADLEAEQAILDVIRGAFPDDAVVGEESGLTGAAASDRTWLVDPLCGTLNFAAGHLLVAVNVALKEGAAVTVAAAADPATGEVFWTDGEQARVRKDAADDGLTPSAVSGLVSVNLDCAYPTVPGFSGTGLLADPAFAQRFRPRVLSSTLALAWVAAGRHTAYVSDGPMHDNVHFASGIRLCQAAGCTVTDLNGEPLGSAPTGLIAAADPETHAALLAMTRTG